MSYVFLTAGSAAFLALYDLFKKISVKGKKDIYEILFFYTLIAFLCSLFFINSAFSISLKYIIFILIKSFLISLSWFLTMKAMSKLDLGIVVPFSLLGTVSTTILAWMFFGEGIGIVQIGGIIVILIGLFLISRISRKKDNEVNDYKYLWLLAFAAFLTSISMILDKYLLNSISRGSVLFWFFLFLCLIYLVICFVKNRKINVSSIKSNLWIIGIGVSIFLSDLLYYFAISIGNGNLSMISIIRKLSVFIGLVLASIFLKEKYFIKKLLVMLLMFVGLSFIIFI